MFLTLKCQRRNRRPRRTCRLAGRGSGKRQQPHRPAPAWYDRLRTADFRQWPS